VAVLVARGAGDADGELAGELAVDATADDKGAATGAVDGDAESALLAVPVVRAIIPPNMLQSSSAVTAQILKSGRTSSLPACRRSSAGSVSVPSSQQRASQCSIVAASVVNRFAPHACC
jgi:hypothetical protein